MEQQNNSGVLFLNRNKKEGSNQPDRVGNLTIDGKKFTISAWNKVGQNAGEFLSIKISDPNEFKEQNNNNNLPY